MIRPPVLFEVSWEVCNTVGGIQSVISTKARTAAERLGDDYIAVGPWLLSENDRALAFDDEPGHEEFCETCRSQGVPVRVGRWRTPGRPRTILVEFSRLIEHKDDVLTRLWEEHKVDSLSGGWEYVEPVLFGQAAGIVIERWWEDYLAPQHRRAVVQAHEWKTSSCLLYLKPRLPSIGTVFTTHGTVLGRAMSSLGHSPSEGLGDRTPEELAEEHQVTARHSIEGVASREADVFTTVSRITADEAELLHGRRPVPLLPNGIDLEVIAEAAGPVAREEARERLSREASLFLGEDVSDADLVAITGRYEFHNKGLDVLLEALARLNDRDGRRVVLFVLMPAGNSGLRSEVLERRGQPLEDLHGPVGISTHNLFDAESDPVQQHCRRFGLVNTPGSRVKVIQVPTYLGTHDGFLDLPYGAVLRALDATCYPSYYEPWGYTSQESLAVGVPTVTSDLAGFGRWTREEGLDTASGIHILPRVGRSYEEVVESMAALLEGLLDTESGEASGETCRQTAARTSWSDLFVHYEHAYEGALAEVQRRSEAGLPQARRPRKTLKVRDTKVATPRLTHFEVGAALPHALRNLQRLAWNYWWCWQPDVAGLFAEISPETWEACHHNPIELLQHVSPALLEEKAADGAFLDRVKNALDRFEAYLGQEPLYDLSENGDAEPGAELSAVHPVAYFSAEFGIHESLRIYGGGLGVLAGDHLKSASDLGLPLVGVGLFYRMGYIQQHLTADGEQSDLTVESDPALLPLECVRTAEGAPLEVALQLPGRTLHLRAWRVRVGRVSLYLLDANTPSNREEDRDITRTLYGGDAEMRLLQEIVLGRGGERLLRRLGVRPAVYHINEGHAAFLTLERVSRFVRDEGLTFEAARELVRGTTAFTTHTPVPAGHDRFDEDLMRRYFSDEEEWVGVPWDRFFALGAAEDGLFNMTWLAMNFASRVNGVSRLHGDASRTLLAAFWPGLLEEETPISSVTNGIHLPTWTHPAIAGTMGVEPTRIVTAEDFAAAPGRVDPQALWDTKQELKRALVEKARTSLQKSFVARNDSPLTLDRMLEGLDERALFIGFARRFAPYKRAHLLFRDVERLRRLLADEDRPVRVFIAGKAHPRDQLGLEILREVANHARGDDLIGKVCFLENYDMDVARALVHGVDIWLNTPKRMQEASGTSGMKSAANGGLNLSIADGWWPEAWDEQNGWMIAGKRVYEDQAQQDLFDSAVLLRLLEEEIVPQYFEREDGELPAAWVERVVRVLGTVPVQFNTDRMVQEYATTAYGPLGRNYFLFRKDRRSLPKRMAQEAQRIRRGFAALKVHEAHIADLSEIQVGDTVDVRLDVHLGALRPEDVRVELVMGQADGDGMRNLVSVPLEATAGGTGAEGEVTSYEGSHRIDGSGRFAHGLRVRARHEEYAGGPLKDLVFWV